MCSGTGNTESERHLQPNPVLPTVGICARREDLIWCDNNVLLHSGVFLEIIILVVTTFEIIIGEAEQSHIHPTTLL